MELANLRYQALDFYDWYRWSEDEITLQMCLPQEILNGTTVVRHGT
jgi:hypothetical protein